ncbi:MAG: molybdopterin-dependent oxidoreductase [Vicinamibacterales bacterium]
MSMQFTRRDLLRGGLAAAGLGLLNVPEWALPVLAADETVLPFADLPSVFNPVPRPTSRQVDVTKITDAFTPKDQFYTTQHYGHPTVDGAAFKLKVTGLVKQTLALSLSDLKAMKPRDLVAGFECSGNRRPFQGLCSNGRWTGVPLKTVLDKAGVQPNAREFVFFGADKGEEEIDFRGQVTKVEQQFGRSLVREVALSQEPFLAWEMNGEPLTVHQGFPLRLVMPGWYGVANVKWLSHIHAQEDQYLGKYQARWYRTLRGEMIDGEMKWKETAIAQMNLKSFVARVSQVGGAHKVLVLVLNDGTPLKSVEVKVDDGPWQAAKADTATNAKYGWKFYRFDWNGATPGEHTLVSRAIDVNGQIQPTADEIASKKTFLEDNSQHPRKVVVS